MKSLLLVACLAACSEDDVQIAIEREDVPYGATYPVGAGLTVHVSAFHVTDSFGDEDPNVDEETDVTVTVSGGTLVACGSKTCILVDPTATRLDVTARTPHGSASTSRPIAGNLSLTLATFGWNDWPVGAIQLLESSSEQVDLAFLSGSQPVSGHVDSYVTTGSVSIDAGTITTNTPGDATIAPADLPDVAPLSIRVTTHAQSLASLASFTANRELDGGDASLTIYTDLPGDAPIDESDFYLDGFDADGYLSLPNLPINASGPYLAPTGLTGGPCSTIAYCFPHASLPSGVNAADTYIELGAAAQRIPIHVLRKS